MLSNVETVQTPYVDGKRLAWLASTFAPLMQLTGLIPAWYTGNELWLWLPLAFAYIGIPIIDQLLGEDTNNPPKEAVSDLEQDTYYYHLIVWSIPLCMISFGMSWFYFSQVDLSIHGYIALVLNTGFVGLLTLVLAHELGHKKDETRKWWARLALIPSGYGHFCVDHNNGHHREVATPEDYASARMGESIYAFACREIPGVFKRAWNIEKYRLERKGQPVFSRHNEVLGNWLISITLFATLTATVGWEILPFILLSSAFTYFNLTSANYVEHYGLLRQKLENGQYERCSVRHSWNSNHMLSNVILLHLERHSDHHAYPTRAYQCLRHDEEAPQLPNGYAGMFLLAYVPPLWYKVMDPLLMKWADNDIEKVNLHEKKAEKLRLKYSDYS